MDESLRHALSSTGEAAISGPLLNAFPLGAGKGLAIINQQSSLIPSGFGLRTADLRRRLDQTPRGNAAGWRSFSPLIRREMLTPWP